jgi:hypothetical protein
MPFNGHAHPVPVRSVEFLVCRPAANKRASKIIRPDGSKIAGNDRIYRVYAAPVTTTDPVAFFQGIATICTWPNAFIQLGGLSPYAAARLRVVEDGPCGSPIRWTPAIRRLGIDSPGLPQNGECLTVPQPTRILVFDLDDVLLVGFNPLDPVQTGVEPWLRSQRLDGYSCAWQLTSSQQLHCGDRARLRLFMLAEDTYEPAELKRYLESYDPQAGVDPCVYDTNRIIYTSPPTIRHHEDGEDLPDFMPVRAGVRWGRQHYVPITIPEPGEIAILDRQRRERGEGRAGGARIHYLPPGEEMTLISDQDFHGGLFNAVWWTLKRWPELSDEEVRSRIEAHVRAHPYTRQAAMLERLEDEVESLCAWAREAQGANHAAHARLLEDITPEYPAQELPLEDAKRELQRTLDRFFGYMESVSGPRLRLLVRGSMGLGKSFQALRTYAERIERHRAHLHAYYRGEIDESTYRTYVTIEWGDLDDACADSFLSPWPRADLYVPSHELAEETVEICRSLGLRAVAVRGRIAPPEGGDKDSGEHLCRRHEIVGALRRNDVRAEGRLVCLNREPPPHWQREPDPGPTRIPIAPGHVQVIPSPRFPIRRPGEPSQPIEERCPYWDDCGYVQQFERIAREDPDVVVRTHAQLVSKPSRVESMHLFQGDTWGGHGKRQPRQVGLVIIDESPVGAMIELANWLPGDLEGAARLVAGPIWGETCAAIMRRVLRAVEDGEDPLGVLDPEQDLEPLGELLSAAAKPPPGAPGPAADDGQLMGWARDYRPPRLPLAMLGRLHEGLRRGEQRFNGIWRAAEMDKRGRHKLHTAALAPPLRLTRQQRVLVMDGTASGTVFSYVLPSVELVDIQVQRNAWVCQVWDKPYSYASLFRPDSKGNSELKPEIEQGVSRLLGMLEHIGHNPALIGPKHAVGQIETEHKAHFGGLRGINRLKEQTAVVVISRPLPSAFDLERQTRAMFPFEPIQFPLKYIMRPSGYRMRDGSRVGVEVQCVDHRLPQAILEQIRDAEVIQGIDRLRLIHNKHPKLIYVLGSLPLDITVDRLTTNPLEDGRLWLLLERANWSMPVLPSLIYDMVKDEDVFGSLKQTQNWVSRTLRRRLGEEEPFGLLRRVRVEKRQPGDKRVPGAFEVLTAERENSLVERRLWDRFFLDVRILD